MTDRHRIVREDGLEWKEYFRLDASGTEIITGFVLIEQPYTAKNRKDSDEKYKDFLERQTNFRHEFGVRVHTPEHMGFSEASEDGDEITSLIEVPQLPQS